MARRVTVYHEDTKIHEDTKNFCTRNVFVIFVSLRFFVKRRLSMLYYRATREASMAMNLPRRVALFALAIFAGIAPSRAAAQATGAVAGVVTDSSGGVIPGVTIEATSRDTGQVRTTATGGDGFYTIPLLNPGVYGVKATLAGFRTTVRENVTVAVNETVRADLALQVGALVEQVVVEAQSPLVETTNATLGVVIDRQKVVDLPLNGRNFT